MFQTQQEQTRSSLLTLFLPLLLNVSEKLKHHHNRHSWLWKFQQQFHQVIYLVEALVLPGHHMERYLMRLLQSR